MIAVFTEGKAPMQTAIDGFAYIYCCGAPGGAIEARIGDKMYGLCVLSDEGYGYISVPEAGTYDLYAQGGTEKLTSVTVTERKKIYRSGLKLPYSLSDMTIDQMAEVISKIKDGKILVDDLPWKIGDKRSIPTEIIYGNASNGETVTVNSNFEIVGVNESGKNNGVTYTDGKPVKYIIKMNAPTYSKGSSTYAAEYDSETGIPLRLSNPDITSLFKPFCYENLIFKKHYTTRYFDFRETNGYTGNYDSVDNFEIEIEKIISKCALKPFSMYDHAWMFTDERTILANGYGVPDMDFGFDAKKVLQDALPKLTTKVGIQYHTPSDDIVSGNEKNIGPFTAHTLLTSNNANYETIVFITGIERITGNKTEYIIINETGNYSADYRMRWFDHIFCI